MNEAILDESTVLRGTQLMLRSWQAGDVEQVFQACQDSEIRRWTTVPSPYSLADAQGFVNTASQRWAAGLPSLGIFAGDDQTLYGSIGFVRSPDDGVLEVGYWVAAQARGRGVACEAVSLVCNWALVEIGAHRIEWTAYVGNVASRRVAQRCGFRDEGVLRGRAEHRGVRMDVWIAGLLRDDVRLAAQ